MTNYILSGTRPFTLEVVKAWYKGETKDIIRFFSPFKNTIFISKKGMVDMYYDKNEVDRFEKELEEYLGEDEFMDMCTDYMRMINDIPNKKTDEDKLNLLSKLVPYLDVFSECDDEPEYLYTFPMRKRLMRVRENTESKYYELIKGIGEEGKDWIYYLGNVYRMEGVSELKWH